MRATACWIAVALLAACGRKAPKPAVPAPVAKAPEQAKPAAVEPSAAVVAEDRAESEQVYRDAVEAKAHARALRTQLSEQRTALAASLAAAEGPQREVLLLVHELTAKDVFDAKRLMAVDTALERADALFTDDHHEEARAAFDKAAAEIQALLGALDGAEPKAHALIDLGRADQELATTREWFEKKKLATPVDLAQAADLLADGRRLVESGDFDGALRKASSVQVLCEKATRAAEALAGAAADARTQRGSAEIALAAWEKTSEAAGGETDLSRAARENLAEGDALLARNDPRGAAAAYQEAALAFETAIDAVAAAEKERLATLRKKAKPPPEPPVIKANQRLSGAVARALEWLARHQDDDGRWDCDAFTKHDPGAARTGGGEADYDVGVTALALLCFLEAGYADGAENPYSINIGQALRFLRASQDDMGVYGGQSSRHFMYNHAIATLAVCEALHRGADPAIAQSAKNAVDFIESARSAGWGWRYEPRGKESDTSLTAWCVRALAAARDAGLEVGDESFKGALAWVDKMTDPDFGQVGYNFPGGSVSRPEGRQLPFPPEQSQAMTAAGLVVRVTCGDNPKLSAICRKHYDLILALPPRWDTERGSIDLYYWYYGTLAARRVGGSRWREWRSPLQAALLEHQAREGSQAGSWDPVDVWSEEGGRVYVTAMATLALIESAPPIAR